MDTTLAVKIGGIVWNKETETAMIILEDPKNQGYALPVLPSEASELLLVLQGDQTSGTFGYKTIETLLKQTGSTPVELRIFAASATGVYISLRYRHVWSLKEVEVGPGTAFCLSLMLRCPIKIQESLWQAMIAPKLSKANTSREDELLFIRPKNQEGINGYLQKLG